MLSLANIIKDKDIMRPPPRTADWTRSEHVIYKTSHDVVKMKSHCSRLVCDNGLFLSPSYWLTLENVCFGSIVVSKTQWGPVYSGSSRCFLTPPRKKTPRSFWSWQMVLMVHLKMLSSAPFHSVVFCVASHHAWRLEASKSNEKFKTK